MSERHTISERHADAHGAVRETAREARLNRRDMLAGVGAGIGALALLPAGAHAMARAATQPAAVPAGRAARPDAGDARPPALPLPPDATLDDFMFMRGSPDGEPVMWVYSGVFVVKPEGRRARPLTRIDGVSYTQASRGEDGAWAFSLEEVGYFCDLATGEVLGALHNPFTGETVAPRPYRSPQRLVFAGNEVTPADALPPGIDFRGEVTRLAAIGDTLAMTEDLYVRVPPMSGPEGERPERIANSLATFIASAAAVRDRGDAWIDCRFAYTTMNTFVPWLGMASVPGVQNMRLIGTKFRPDAADAIPQALRERIDADHPDFLIA